ncbi:DNA-binding NarL/FixJ family response regulator [Actinokineospora baliensis]|uniref:LuxR C-terminal-related transcriptional regulator n=1 Tax=Actinokineospora baliensis TaxID=547056 RepID=UPI001955FD8E|nr:LuxR C-terminal-related transcriptional regulator [Actinokineospora baliensis]MBM7774780.1 DNA-binding NarL/FixJ family response regulator [Actinokineospora baliensis]
MPVERSSCAPRCEEPVEEGVSALGEAVEVMVARLTGAVEARLMPVPTVLRALETLARSVSELDGVLTRMLVETADPVRLTPREQEVLDLLCAGHSATGMARRLGLSPRTVTKHQERLYRKLGTSDRLGAVLRAQRLGLVPGAR